MAAYSNPGISLFPPYRIPHVSRTLWRDPSQRRQHQIGNYLSPIYRAVDRNIGDSGVLEITLGHLLWTTWTVFQ